MDPDDGNLFRVDGLLPQMVDYRSIPSWHIAMPPGGGVHSIGKLPERPGDPASRPRGVTRRGAVTVSPALYHCLPGRDLPGYPRPASISVRPSSRVFRRFGQS